MYIVMLWILFYYSLLLIAIIYFENLNIKIQYAANNPGVFLHYLFIGLVCIERSLEQGFT